jgi:polyphosphate kinase 2 (PPK2 family)
MNNKETKDFIKKARKIAKPFRVTDGSFRLKDIDPDETLHLTSEDKPRAKEALAMGVSLLAELQNMLYAQDQWAVLLIFQAMDAAARTAPSSTSCPASIRRVARYFPSKRRAPRSWITIIFGVA